jgi:diaminohydroxyphosphoribosylaminopyrimidine deaminase / 5-amino-6-(5-phosphoribosylamino)uracil reductase
MITKNNIFLLFDFIRKQKKISNLNIKYSNKCFLLTSKSQLADIIIKKDNILFQSKINKSLEEILQILIPILLNNKNFFIGQIGQSLDGKIALNNGKSHYINDKLSIFYLHCLRSISQAVVVGVNTIIKDNPQLTTRMIKGPNPVRVIIDPSLKLNNNYKIFKDGLSNIIFTHSPIQKKFKNTTIYKLQKKDFTLQIYKKLQLLNFSSVLIEGGATTLSKFIDNKLIDIMQFIISPMIIGSGINSLNLKPISNLDNALRPKNKIYRFGKEIIVSLNF